LQHVTAEFHIMNIIFQKATSLILLCDTMLAWYMLSTHSFY